MAIYVKLRTGRFTGKVQYQLRLGDLSLHLLTRTSDMFQKGVTDIDCPILRRKLLRLSVNGAYVDEEPSPVRIQFNSLEDKETTTTTTTTTTKTKPPSKSLITPEQKNEKEMEGLSDDTGVKGVENAYK